MKFPRDPKRRLACLEQMLDWNFLKLKTGQGKLSPMRESDQAVYQITLEAAALDVDRLDCPIDEILAQYDTCRSAVEKTMSATVPRSSFSSLDGSRQQLLASMRRR